MIFSSGDTVVEDNETFTVTLGAVTAPTAVQTAAITSGAVGTGTIVNDDSETLAITSPSITEGNSGTKTLTFTVTSPKAVEGGFTVAYSTADGSASASESDYAAQSDRLSTPRDSSETLMSSVAINF